MSRFEVPCLELFRGADEGVVPDEDEDEDEVPVEALREIRVLRSKVVVAWAFDSDRQIMRDVEENIELTWSCWVSTAFSAVLSGCTEEEA